MAGLWQKMRNGVQSVLYKLGPTYCILLGAFILFGSFIIQLITSIGVPYITSFTFFRFDLSNTSFVILGMWAACAGQTALYFPTRPDLPAQPEAFNCPPAKWGWDEAQFSGITRNFFHHTLPKALIFHPISCIFTFLAMVAALVTIKRKRSHFVLPIFSFMSCLFALISFFIDVATFVPARGKLMSQRGTEILGAVVLSTSLGPAFWLSLATFCLDIMGNAIIIFGYGIWRYQRTPRTQRRSGAYTDDVESKGTEMQRRGYAAQGSIGSFGDVNTTTASKSSQGRRGLDDDEDEDVFADHKAAEGERDHSEEVISDGDETPWTAPRRSGDARSMTDRSFAPTQYEDAENEAEDDDDGSARSVYEDAPTNVGSRGFLKRKPVEPY